VYAVRHCRQAARSVQLAWAMKGTPKSTQLRSGGLASAPYSGETQHRFKKDSKDILSPCSYG